MLAVLSPNKQRSFEPFMCLEFVCCLLLLFVFILFGFFVVFWGGLVVAFFLFVFWGGGWGCVCVGGGLVLVFS